MDNQKEKTKTCHYCKEEVNKDAIYCKFCNKKIGMSSAEKFILYFFTIIFVGMFLSVVIFSGQDNHKKSLNSKNISCNDNILYEVISEKDISYAGCKRVGIKIIVPDNTGKNEINCSLEKVFRDRKTGWQDITIWAYKQSEKADVESLPFSMGIKEYSTCK